MKMSELKIGQVFKCPTGSLIKIVEILPFNLCRVSDEKDLVQPGRMRAWFIAHKCEPVYTNRAH